jgi:hypothetical protein
MLGSRIIFCFTADCCGPEQLTDDEKAFWKYTNALAEWLEPHCAAVRQPKVVPSSKANGSASTSVQNGPSDVAPPWQEPPEVLTKYFEGIYTAAIVFDIARLMNSLRRGY